MEGVEIRCPKCSWQPDGGAYWACSNCGHGWNTFDTQGRCPKCTHQHNLTQCIAFRGGCDRLSPHLDWYLDLAETVESLIEVIKEEKVDSL